MSGMDINFYSVNKEFHRYSTDDFALLEIGVGSYNTSSLANFFSLDPNTFAPIPGKTVNPDIVEFFSGAAGGVVAQKLLGFTGMLGDMEILAYDEINKKYESKKRFNEIARLDPKKFKPEDFAQPVFDLQTFLQQWNNVQLGIITDKKVVNGYKAVAHRIQNSASGCITFEVELPVLRTPRKSKIRLYFLESRDHESSRTVSLNGAPFISAPPTTAEGLKFGFRNKNAAPVGVYPAPSFTGNSQEDMVGGALRMTWDDVNKSWESGTQQVLARLLDDVPAASIPDLTLEQMQSLTAEDSYNVPAEENPWMGKPGKGRAIVLGMENGNPNLYGPNFRGNCEDADTNKKSIVMAVNRSSKAFKSGTPVVLSLIKEWLIVAGEGATQPPAPKGLNFGNFEYQQYIIPLKKFFSSSKEIKKTMPNNWISKIRDDYYLNKFKEGDDVFLGKIKDSEQINDIPLLIKLNLLASEMGLAADIENYDSVINYFISSLKDTSRVNSILRNANDNSKIDGRPVLNYIDEEYGPGLADGGITESGPITSFTKMGSFDYYKQWNIGSSGPYAFAKNATLRTQRDVDSIDFSKFNNYSNSDILFAKEIPMFWGLIFPDGYKNGSARRIFSNIPDINRIPIYHNDGNLKEVSVEATSCFLDLKDPTKNFNFGQRIIEENNEVDILDKVRKTGGLYYDATKVELSDVNYLYKMIAMEKDVELPYQGVLLSDENKNNINLLEPISPQKIQFSPMSIEFLYSNSNLELVGGTVSNFNTLYSNLQYLDTLSFETKKGQLWTSSSILEYGQYLWKINDQYKAPLGGDPAFWNDVNAIYSLRSLAFSNAFGPYAANISSNPVIVRHLAPEGTAFNITPKPIANGTAIDVRCPIIPIITCKSKIFTSAEKLTFTVNQLLGMSPQVRVQSGKGPSIVSLPFGAGLFWTDDPGTPIKELSTPQWGDRNKTDNIDSLGTSALHVRVFEGWPINQTIYLGYIYTPLHFNTAVSEFEEEIDFSVTPPTKNQILIDNKRVPSKSDVDFPIPTDPKGKPLIYGTIIDVPNDDDDDEGGGEEKIAPVSKWLTNTIRRGKLLSGGGFVYLKTILAINDVESKPEPGGSGYVRGDTFEYPDGSILTVENTKDNGEILSVSFEPNFGDDKILRKNFDGFTSLNNVQPVSKNEGGSGASFKILSFQVVFKIGYDAPPKELCPITRISQPSKSGEKIAEGINTITVTLQESDKKELDIFYFFHNDPTHYSVDTFLAFNGGWAQYAICEVNIA
jgi:hypothetical protein